MDLLCICDHRECFVDGCLLLLDSQQKKVEKEVEISNNNGGSDTGECEQGQDKICGVHIISAGVVKALCQGDSQEHFT